MLLQRGKIHFLIHLFRALPLLISIIHITLQHCYYMQAVCSLFALLQSFGFSMLFIN